MIARMKGIDIHRETQLNNIHFDAWMCALFGSEWRWEMSDKLQRMYAKRWNFASLYGMDPENLKRIFVG